MELEWERLSSNQNERTLGVGEGGARKRTRTNKGGGGRGVKTRESRVSVLFECPLKGLSLKQIKK